MSVVQLNEGHGARKATDLVAAGAKLKNRTNAGQDMSDAGVALFLARESQ